ncbi:MAG: translation initiation factor IF-2 [Chloroflexi bacterium]|nr:translation initiation factor IF-2 [Chloroflexota bacterium]
MARMVGRPGRPRGRAFGGRSRNGRGGNGRPGSAGGSRPGGATVAVAPRKVALPPSLTVKELADALGVGVGQVIKQLMASGVMANINQEIDYDTAAIVATDLTFEVAPRAIEEEAGEEALPPDEEAHLVARPPVVTVMGHVDHGKTSLLDAIRQTNVTAREHGGITQHIGAYQAEINNRKITFLDTPGHEAFTAMRARGAQVTDVAVIVVAADDGVKPQTLEAISHARAAQVPLVVAINKIDKPEANPDRVKQQLVDAGVLVEEWGGDTVSVPVSAKKREGLDHLLEMILLVADLRGVRANPDRAADGTVIEARKDRQRGPVATLLVQNGTLKIGDIVVAGAVYGRVREVLGLSDVPKAGDRFRAVPDDKTARAIAQRSLRREQALTAKPERPTSLETLFEQIQAGKVKELRVVLKTDVDGSIAPIRESLERFGGEQVKVRVLHAAPGTITESDVQLASASDAVIIGFNTRLEPGAKDAAEQAGVDLRVYSVIYQLVDDVKKALEGLLEPVYVEVVDGHAEVRQVFVIRGAPIAGCYVTDGRLLRGELVRVKRDKDVVFEGKIASLRRVKEDVREVGTGYECGVGVDGLKDAQPGDMLECYRKERRGAVLA